MVVNTHRLFLGVRAGHKGRHVVEHGRGVEAFPQQPEPLLGHRVLA